MIGGPRASRLAALPASVDVLVVGGGITGAGIARHTAWLGWQTLVIDRGDYACGTSSRSSKLLHGGLRYLEQYEFGLVFESVRERMAAYRLAPHLVRPLPFVFPQYPGQRPGMLKLDVGLTLYDLMAGWRSFGRHRRLSAGQLQQAVPGLRPAPGFRYWDAQTNDARLTLAVVEDARQLGASTLNYLALVAAEKTSRGWLCELRDELSGRSYEVAAQQLAVAVGPWFDSVAALFSEHPAASVRPTLGIHLLVPAARLSLGAAVVLLHPGDGRVMFVIPTETGTLIGTTDTDQAVAAEFDLAAADVEYLLAAVNHYFPEVRLTPADVFSAYAGLRPLISDGRAPASLVSREHAVVELAAGVFAIGGGKLTTWRVMARDMVRQLSKRAPAPLRSGRALWRRPLPGGDFRSESDLADCIRELATSCGLAPGVARNVVYSYGRQAREMLGSGAGEPLGQLALPAGAVNWGVCAEQAQTLDDLMRRRTRLFYTEYDQGLSLAPRIAELAAASLGWDEKESARQLAAYRALCRRYRP